MRDRDLKRGWYIDKYVGIAKQSSLEQHSFQKFLMGEEHVWVISEPKT